jgi:hypothetical protein
MADTFTFDKEHLTNLKTTIGNLSSDLTGDANIAAIQEWGGTPLWDKSTWNSSTSAGGGGGAGNDSAELTLLPGNPDVFPAAKLLMARGTTYASQVINAVNWVHDVLTNLSTNIDFTITKIDSAEHDNKLTVDQAVGDFNQTISDLGGPPVQTGPPGQNGPPHIPVP